MLRKKSRTLRGALIMGLVAVLCEAGNSTAANNSGSSTPEGFGAGTKGGAGGEVVTVTTVDQLTHELCRSVDPSTGICSDDTPRIIQLAANIDFTGTEGTGSGLGCHPYPQNQAVSLVLLDSNDTHCNGFPTSQISFDNAGNDPLLVGSNKTLIGVGTSGVIKGKGLFLHGVKNVIVRNVTVTDINPSVVFAGDAIAMTDVDHVWIDHNRVHNIGRQMIVTGVQAATNITISWNDFDGNTLYAPYGDGRHYWNALLNAYPQTITISDNWFHQFSGRAPHVARGGTIHLVNNYYQDSIQYEHALDADQSVNVLLEGNYYDSVYTPILMRSDMGNIFGFLGTADVATQARCEATLGRDCAANTAMPPPTVNGFAQQSSVMQVFQSNPPASVVIPYSASDVPAAVKGNAGPGHI